MPPPAIGPANAGGMVIVEIGPEKKHYHIHKALITHHSEYFRGALRKPWIEAENGVVTLVDIDMPEFNLFVHWLYTQQLPDCRDDFIAWSHVVGREEDDTVGKPMAVLTLIKAYALGDRILAKRFRQATNDLCISREFVIWMDPHTIQPIVAWAFANIPSDRPILQYFVNKFCVAWCPHQDCDEDIQALGELPIQFIKRVLRRFAVVRDGPDCSPDHVMYDDDDNCYREHVTDAELEECKEDHFTYDTDIDYSWAELER